LNDLIRESLSLVENDLTLKGIKLETDCAGNGAIVCVDSNQIQQVLLNLAANAADAMPDGGRLCIATRLLPDESSVEIRVTDDGCGMEEEVLNHVFDPFFTTKEQGKGTGLGLAICQRIVEEHEGRIEIHSRLDRGTTVLIHLPHTPMEAAVDE
jgi:signal transduction histidine kinase